jgi:hypothetical protein
VKQIRRVTGSLKSVSGYSAFFHFVIGGIKNITLAADVYFGARLMF